VGETVTPAHDRDVPARYLEDAAHFPGGHAQALFLPTSERAVADILRRTPRVLPIGAQSSLTGGATPFGDALLGTARLADILDIQPARVRLQAGVPLDTLDLVLAERGQYYPPSPTFTGSFVGGIVSTNAAGAATFKYGTTRDWIETLTVVLADGDVLDIERGAVHAHPDGYVDLELARGRIRLPVPTYRMPAAAKVSAGYFAAPGMDLIDLFIGAEGTLGVVTDVTLRVLPVRPAHCLAFLTCPDKAAAWSFAGALREAAMATWQSADPAGIDIAGIEHMDARCMRLLRDDGVDRKLGVPLPDAAHMGLWITLELPPQTTSTEVYDMLARAGEAGAADTALARFCALLARYDLLDRVEFATPDDRARAAQLIALREAVPAAVNHRVGLAQQRIDPHIDKTAADVIVPFDALETFVDFCGAELSRHGVDAAIWGHLSDGNLHPNVIPRTMDDVTRGQQAMLAIGREAMRHGGSPLAEHGVGRNRTKQTLLREMYGERGLDEMRQVKRALDPEGKLACGVIFPMDPADP
jgi:D-lactate dehydrogenase (cytochrome)